MKRWVKSVLLLGVLVVLFASYFLVQQIGQRSQVQEAAETYAFTQQTSDALTGLAWGNGDEEYHFVRQEGAWVNAADDAFPVNQDAVQELADALLALEGTRKLENVENPADYGLDAPEFAVTAEWSDGTSTEYSMGDETPFRDGYYLGLSDVEDVIYTVDASLSDMFSVTTEDLAQLEEIPAAQNPTRLVVGSALDITYKETSTTINSDQHWYETDTGDAVDDAKAQSLLDLAQSVSWSALVTAKATEEEMAQWQLDAASITEILLFDGENVATELWFGGTDDAGNRYARLPDSNMVYAVAAEDVDDLLNADMDAIWCKDLMALDCEDLRQVTFAIGDLSWNFLRTEEKTVSETTEQDGKENGEAEEDAIAVLVTQNGQETDADAFAALWEQVAALSATQRVDETPEGDILLSIQAENESGVAAGFEIYAYDADSYAVPVSEDRLLLIPADSVDKLIRTLKQMR